MQVWVFFFFSLRWSLKPGSRCVIVAARTFIILSVCHIAPHSVTGEVLTHRVFLLNWNSGWKTGLTRWLSREREEKQRLLVPRTGKITFWHVFGVTDDSDLKWCFSSDSTYATALHSIPGLITRRTEIRGVFEFGRCRRQARSLS